MNILGMKNYLCEYKTKCLPSVDVPTDCIDSLTRNLVGLSKEMVLMSWLQQVYDYSISLHTIRFKTKGGSIVKDLNEFLNSPDIAIAMNQDDHILNFEIKVNVDKNFWYELTIKEQVNTYNIALTSDYNNKNGSLNFSFDNKLIEESAIDLAVYLQFKAETIFDDSISLDVKTIVQFLELFGAVQIDGMVVNANTIDMHVEREKRCDSWYQIAYELIDKKIGEKATVFLKKNVNEQGFKEQLSFLLNNHLNVFGIQDILNKDAEITDIAVNRPTEFWYNKNNKWLKVDNEAITFSQLIDFANHFAKFNDLEISAENPLCNGVMPSGNKCQVVIPPSVESNTVAILISIK